MSHRIQLLATCLAEHFYPATLQQMVLLLERLGVEVHFPREQTCCGQPLFNSGLVGEARRVARSFLKAFARDPAPLVAPSGSCVDMVRHHYSELFPEGCAEHSTARDVAARTYEFTEYLVHVLGVTELGAHFAHRVTYHASCHYLRGLGLEWEAKQLLAGVQQLELIGLEQEQRCCGFGGVFSVLYPEVSRAMLQQKVRCIEATGAEVVVACDAGCLMNIAGGLRRAGSSIRAMHLIDVLASTRGGP